MQLSIVIICWNDLKVIVDCLQSIFEETHALDLDVIVSDNGSTDGSVEFIRRTFPQVRIVENAANLGYAKGNNAGIRVAIGKYVLILNPDTIIRDRALEKLVTFAEQHPEAGAFGCCVLNPDGSFQNPAKPLPTLLGYFLSAIYLRWPARISKRLETDVYQGWDGRSEREIGFQSGCCVMFRADVLHALEGFDERFFYHYEETDLCYRVWKSGHSILYFPEAEITHLGGQSVGKFPIRFALETYRGGYRFFHKYYGPKGVIQIRRIYLLHLFIRMIGYRVLWLIKRQQSVANRLQMYRVAFRWNRCLRPLRFIEDGEEPNLGYDPLAPAPKIAGSPTL
jgi:GT2 family glycosyltransferase